MSRSIKKGAFVDEHLKKKIDALNESRRLSFAFESYWLDRRDRDVNVEIGSHGERIAP